MFSRVTITHTGITINGRNTGPCIYAHKANNEKDVVILALIKRFDDSLTVDQFNIVVDNIVLPNLPPNLLSLRK